jgi:hypothetical protein
MDISYTFTLITQFFSYLLDAELIAAAATVTCASACLVSCAAWHAAGAARQRRHPGRGCAPRSPAVCPTSKQYLQEQAADAGSPRPDTGNGRNDCPHHAGPATHAAPAEKEAT